MRLSQQTFVDKYIEKVILGAAAVIGLGIIYFFVLGTPYGIEPKPGEPRRIMRPNFSAMASPER